MRVSHREPSFRRDPNVHLPLTPAMFHVMAALSDGDQHGYAIIKDVAGRTSGAVTLSTGTLYGIIKRLLGEGLIVELRRRPAVEHDDQRRRYYRLTDEGRRLAIAETERLEKLLARARGTRLLRALKPL